MDVYWLEQSIADVPGANDWLSAHELAQLNAMRFPKRRMDWQLGRWTAKRAVAACFDLPDDRPLLARIELRPASSGAPEVFIANKPGLVTISLTHCEGMAACAVALESGPLGCDLETVEPRSDAFVHDYFTTEEQDWVTQACEDDRPLLWTLLWSAKESALKALGVGLRLDTRSVIVNPGNVQEEQGDNRVLAAPRADGADGWHPMHVRQVQGRTFQGWWRPTRSLVRTVVGAPLPAPPVVLNVPTSSNR